MSRILFRTYDMSSRASTAMRQADKQHQRKCRRREDAVIISAQLDDEAANREACTSESWDLLDDIDWPETWLDDIDWPETWPEPEGVVFWPDEEPDIW